MTEYPELFADLAAPFASHEVKTRSQANRQFRYITARTAMNRLDEVVGPENWWDDYVPNDESVLCRLSIRLPDGRVVTKTDAGGHAGMSDTADDEKSAYSDAFKRAAAKFGVGRYLYGDGAPRFRVPGANGHPTSNGQGHGHVNGHGQGHALGSPAASKPAAAANDSKPKPSEPAANPVVRPEPIAAASAGAGTGAGTPAPSHQPNLDDAEHAKPKSSKPAAKPARERERERRRAEANDSGDAGPSRAPHAVPPRPHIPLGPPSSDPAAIAEGHAGTASGPNADIDSALATAQRWGVPRSGRSLFGWLREIDQRADVALMKYLMSWGKLREFPERIVEWDARQVETGYSEACRKLEELTGVSPFSLAEMN